MLDLVKAFERIPHWLLLQEAKALGYPVWMLKLSVATYRLKRVLRIGTVVSNIVVALRGITAGSGFATTEMKLVMLRLVLRTGLAHPTVTPTLFVGDLSAETIGPAEHIVEQLGKLHGKERWCQDLHLPRRRWRLMLRSSGW